MFSGAQLKKFSDSILLHCTQMGYHDIGLNEKEIEQLSWYLYGSENSPALLEENLNKDLHAEIMRRLATRYSFELVLRGDKDAYNEFVKAQQEPKLSWKHFQFLANEAKSLDKDVKAVVSAGCLLTMTNKAKQELTTKDWTPPSDSEQFLTALANALVENKNLIPVASTLSPEQLALLPKMYWPNTHFHHLMYTEGGIGMTKSLIEGIKSKQFSRADFLVWKWRWLTNLFGFKSGPAAKYYNDDVHSFAMAVIRQLEELFFDQDNDFLRNNLMERAQLIGLSENKLFTEQQIFALTHLAAYSNEVNINNTLLSDMGAGYFAYHQEFNGEDDDKDNFAALYEAFRTDPSAISPTHTPAILNNSFSIYKNSYEKSIGDSLALATQFTCQVLAAVYAMPHDKIISCRLFAQPSNLKVVLEEWNKNHKAFEFKVDASGELVAERVKLIETLEVRSSPRLGATQ